MSFQPEGSRLHSANFRAESDSGPAFSATPHNRRTQVDVHGLLSKEIRSSNDITKRIYSRDGNSRTYIPKPMVPYVPGPTDAIFNNGTPYAGMSYGDAMRQRNIDAQMRARHSSQPRVTLPTNIKDHLLSEVVKPDKIDEDGEGTDEIGIEDNYFLFDSFYKEDQSRPSDGLYVFDLQKLNDGIPIKNIIEMEISNFSVPNIAVQSYEPNMFKFRTLYTDFENLRAQQFIHGPPGTLLRTFHFQHNLTTNTVDLSGRLFADPSRYSEYIFTMPVMSIQELRVRFKVPPGRYVPFEEDVFVASTVTSAGPSPANRQITTLNPHGLALTTTVDVYISDFNSTNVVLNNFINNKNGHRVEVIDANVLQFTADTTGISEGLGAAVAAIGGNPQFKVRIADRRIAMMVRFRSIVSKITNFIAP